MLALLMHGQVALVYLKNLGDKDHMFGKRVLVSGWILFLFALILKAQDRPIPSEKPRLIVGIQVSGMRYDYLVRYWDKFGDGGFRRLVDNGTFCRNATHDYLIPESGSAVASIATGSYPDIHGIISNYWYDRLKEKVTYCIGDDDAETVGGSYDQGRYSPSRLMVSTVSDELKLSDQFRSKVISICLDPVASVLSGGHAADASYWYDNTNGRWITSTYYTDSLPGWVEEFNDKQLADLYLTRTWEPLMPADQYGASLPDTSKYETGIDGQTTFPYDLEKLSHLSRKKIRYDLLKITPYGNTYTADFAAAALVNENLGKDNRTDWLNVIFSTNALASDHYSSRSVEMEDLYLRLDKDLEHFLDLIDQEVGLKNTLIYLTADNASANKPEYLGGNRLPAGFFNYNAALSLLKTYLNVIYGNGDWIRFYYAQQIYLNRVLIEDSRLSISEFQDRVARFMVQFEGVSNALTASDLVKNNYTRGTFQNIQKSYNQKRSGDVLLYLTPGWVEKGVHRKYASSVHFDSHVPLIWYGWKIGRDEISRKVSVTDIMPTIAYFLNISRPSGMQGNIIGELTE